MVDPIAPIPPWAQRLGIKPTVKKDPIPRTLRRRHTHATRRYDGKLAKTSAFFNGALHDPVFVRDLGFPEAITTLPESTVDILTITLTLDKRQHQQPKSPYLSDVTFSGEAKVLKSDGQRPEKPFQI